MSKPLKVGMIGAGGIARAHMTPYLEHPDRVQLVAICDMVEPLAQAYAKDAGVDTVYTDLDDMLSNADIEAVDICTGHAQHAPTHHRRRRSGQACARRESDVEHAAGLPRRMGWQPLARRE